MTQIPTIPNLNGCVYKLYWGEVYVIVKAKTFLRSRTIIEYALGKYSDNKKPDLLYNRFFAYIRAYPQYEFTVKILFKSDSPYQLLKREQEELDKAVTDTNCFNNSFDAYVPKGIQGRQKKWVNRGHYLNFMMWKKRRKPIAQ